MTQYIAGIGARETPIIVCNRMTTIGEQMANDGWVLRSGGAKGADTAFEAGWNKTKFANNKQIFLPYKGYNGSKSTFTDVPKAAYDLIDDLWDDVQDRSFLVRTMFARNCQQILGPNLDQFSDLVICWTIGGKVVGGTGRAIRVAYEFGIPVINLAIDKFDYSLYGA